MTIKASGTGSLSFEDDIEKEFGENPSRSLGSYRRDHPDFSNKNCGSLTNLPLDDGIPTSGEIKFSDFYGKKLNIVVDYYSVAENREDVTNEATMLPHTDMSIKMRRLKSLVDIKVNPLAHLDLIHIIYRLQIGTMVKKYSLMLTKQLVEKNLAMQQVEILLH